MSLLLFTEDAASRTGLPIDAEAVRALGHSDAARYLVLRRGRVLVQAERPARMIWRRYAELGEQGENPDDAVFLGYLEDEPCFAAVPVEAPLTANDRYNAAPGVDNDGFVGLYEAAMALPAAESRLAARAVHFANWINRTRYCGVCGIPMRTAAAGRKRVCTNPPCGHEEFPRTDPVIITLVTYGERCLLGRQPRFPPRRYAAIAGFVEPGETLEGAVRREVCEEVGLGLRTITYKGSQPWPFPASLMFGCLAEATGDRVTLRDGELEDARWFERAQLAELLAPGSNPAAEIALPPEGVIGRQLIAEWVSRRS